MIRILAVGLTLLAAGEAVALSCMRPNLGEDFNRAQADEATYYLGVGTLQVDEPLPVIPNVLQNDQAGRPPVTVKARFEGRFMGTSGFGAETVREVEITVFCLSVWCGGFPPMGAEMAVFFEEGEDGLRLMMGPCGGPLKMAPSPEQIAALEACMQAGTCGPAEIAVFTN